MTRVSTTLYGVFLPLLFAENELSKSHILFFAWFFFLRNYTQEFWLGSGRLG